MIIPPGTSHLLDELWDGIAVCNAFAMLRTADSRGDWERDAAHIRERLDDFPVLSKVTRWTTWGGTSSPSGSYPA